MLTIVLGNAELLIIYLLIVASSFNHKNVNKIKILFCLSTFDLVCEMDCSSGSRSDLGSILIEDLQVCL